MGGGIGDWRGDAGGAGGRRRRLRVSEGPGRLCTRCWRGTGGTVGKEGVPVSLITAAFTIAAATRAELDR
jgi:hypothetical protein